MPDKHRPRAVGDVEPAGETVLAPVSRSPRVALSREGSQSC